MEGVDTEGMETNLVFGGSLALPDRDRLVLPACCRRGRQ